MDTDNVAVEGMAESPVPLSVGTILREARIAQGLSVADVAASIKFAPRQVEALEADDFSHLPELAFVRGFVRSYARLLHIDETPLLNELPLAHQKLSSFQEDLADVPFLATQSTRRINIVWIAVALGLAAVLAFAVWQTQEKPVPQAALPISVPAELVAVSAVAAVSEVVAASPVAATAPSAPLPVPAPMPAAVVKAASAPVVAAPVAVKLTQGPIHLVFEDESWVDIKDKFGKTVFKQVNPPKTEQWVTGRPPFSLVIGNASGVRLYYEGEEVDLDEFTDVEVARLILE